MESVSQPSIAGNLPFEILSIIFRYISQDNEEKYYPEKLLYVCKWWNAVVMEDKVLWSRIDILYPGPIPLIQLMVRTSAYIKRSGDTPIDIKFVTPKHKPVCGRFCEICPQELRDIAQLFSLLIGYEECNIIRWRSLVLDYRFSLKLALEGEECHYSLYELLMSYSMPQLKTAEIIAPESVLPFINSVRIDHIVPYRWVVPGINASEFKDLPGWIYTAFAFRASSSPPRYSALSTLRLMGGALVFPVNTEFTSHLTTLRVECVWLSFMTTLVKNPTIHSVKDLYISADGYRPHNYEVLLLDLMEKMAQLEVLSIVPSLAAKAEQILRSKGRTTLVVPISHTPYWDESDDEDPPRYILFD